MMMKVHKYESRILEASRSCCSSIHSPITRLLNNRPHSLPIQRLPIRDPNPQHGPRPVTFYSLILWLSLCCIALLQAHIPLPSASILCFSTTNILSRRQHLPNPFCERCEARGRNNRNHCRGVWTLRLLGADTSAIVPVIPVQ